MSAPMKNSRQRNAILECVMSHHDHPTADIIYQELRESFPNISLGTVYRNLSLLTSLGKIMKITCENHADRFDGQTIPHAHFECKSCGCLQDIPFKPSVHPQEDIGEGFDGIISDYYHYLPRILCGLRPKIVICRFRVDEKRNNTISHLLCSRCV